MIEFLIATTLVAQTQAPPVAEPRLVGVAGICARWEADPLHAAEVVVVRPSGNATLDQALPPTVKATAWPKVAGDTGGWTGRWVAVGGAAVPPGPLPDCSALPKHERPPA